MTADPAEDNQIEIKAPLKPDLELSPTKALFCGEIVVPCFWPFPQMPGEQKAILDMVLDSVDRFLDDKQDHFR